MKGVVNLKLCLRCGKETDELIDNVCKDCFIRTFKAVEELPGLEIRVCPNCGAYYRKGKWVESDLKKGITDEVARNIKVSDLLEKREIKVDCEVGEPPGGVVPAVLRVEGEIFNQSIKEEHDFNIKIKRESCVRCSRIAGGYYEAIVQIRAEGRKASKEELDSCLVIIAERVEGHASFVTKLLDVKNGVDVYVASKSAAQDGAREIIKRFGGETRVSPKLIGRRGGKDLYRLTILVRLPRFVRGDIVYFRKRVVLLTSVSKHTEGIYLEDGMKAGKMDHPDLKFLMNLSDAKEAVLLVVYEKDVEVLDPETFRAVTIKKPLFLTEGAGEEVRVVKIDDRVFLVPGKGVGFNKKG
ncbi:MAG: NMD3 family protein [Candidatus Syntrophoarchaeum sp. GoM_oil]|nr:MAG: NMD3 family protein [Candidatus Syntrophoarchaeum sp. GoM_oil]